MDSWLPEAWPQAVLDAARKFKQGHLINWNSGVFGADFGHAVCNVTKQSGSSGSGYVRVDDAFSYVAVTSQTCDICEDGKKRPCMPWVSVVPVYDILPSLSHGQDGHVRGNRILYLVPLTHSGFVGPEHLWVADLRFEFPLEKSALVMRKPIEGFACEEDYAFFADKLAFRRNRPAIDQRVRELITGPLGKVLEKKALHPESIREVRIRCGPSWDQVDRVQLFVLVAGVDEVDPVSEAFESWRDEVTASLPEGLAFLQTKVMAFNDFPYVMALSSMVVDYSSLSMQ